jgi:hypothetical protein
MTKPGFTEKRIALAINEEASRIDSTLERNAFIKGTQFILSNLDAIIEKPFYVYVVVSREGNEPIVSAHTRETLEALLDDYCGATATYNYSGKRISYTAHNPKYPSDYQGYYTYEVTDRDDVVTEYYDVYCVEFKAEKIK